MYGLSRLKLRASEKMRGLLTNNEDPFPFLENQPPRPGMGNMISVKNRIREDLCLVFTKFQRKNRSSADVMTIFCSSNQCH